MDDLKEKSDIWKIQLTIAINFMFSKENDGERVMNSKNDSIENMINDKENEDMEESFESLLSKYQIGLETSMKGSNLIFNCAYLLYYKCQKIIFKCGGPYLNYPGWIKNETSH